MLHQIMSAAAHPDHRVTIAWADGARGVVDFRPFIARGGLFAALREPGYFVHEMSIMRGGLGLTWPNEVDFSADALRHDVVTDGQVREHIEASDAFVEKYGSINDEFGTL